MINAKKVRLAVSPYFLSCSIAMHVVLATLAFTFKDAAWKNMSHSFEENNNKNMTLIRIYGPCMREFVVMVI